MKELQCDYLVVGGGATGLSFADELIHNSTEFTVVIVDRYQLGLPFIDLLWIHMVMEIDPQGSGPVLICVTHL